MNRVARYITLGLLLAGLMLLAYRVIENFLTPIGWAIILVYVTWPLHCRLHRLMNGRESLSALTMTLLLGAMILIPFIGLTVLLQAELVEFLHRVPEWLNQKPTIPQWLALVPYFGEEIQLILDQFEDLQGLIRKQLWPKLTGIPRQLLEMIEGFGYQAFKLVFTLLAMFFFYRDGSKAVSQIRRVSRRVLGDRVNAYLATVESTVKGVVYGIVLTAIAQGTLAGLGYWAVGLQAPILLSAFTMLFSMVPFGTPVVWGSASLWLLLHGEHWSGFALALWGAFVVSWIDNLVRPLVISTATQIPFLLVVFGALGGLTAFGFIGLFLGPVILAISLAVWREWVEQQIGEGG